MLAGCSCLHAADIILKVRNELEIARERGEVEGATQVVLLQYTELLQPLSTLSHSNDSSTVAAAYGLLKQLSDFRLVLSLHIIQDILAVTGPCSRLFQAVSTDLSVAVITVKACTSSFQAKREDSIATSSSS